MLVMFMPRSLTLVMAALLVGCGASGRPTGKLTGTVTYNDAPMTEGKVLATSQDGLATVETDIIDGRYTLSACPLGDVRLVVLPPDLGRTIEIPDGVDKARSGRVKELPAEKVNAIGNRSPLTEKQKERQKRYQDFPSAYRRFDQSLLRTTVQSGDNEFNIAFKSTK